MQTLSLSTLQNISTFSKASSRISPSFLHFSPNRNFAVLQFDPKKNYYRVLNVGEKASAGEIKKAFYALAKQYHPDVNKGNADRFKEINEAYEVLGENSKRRSYDEMRQYNNSSSSSASSARSSSSYSNTNTSRTSYNSSNNRGAGQKQNAQYSHFYYDQKGNPYSQSQQKYYEETLKNYFNQWGQTQQQWAEFEAEMKKKERNAHNPYSDPNRPRSFSDFFSGSARDPYSNADSYHKFQEEIHKSYKDEEYRRMEEMARLRKQSEEEFMREAEKKVQEVIGKVQGAKKFVKNFASNFEHLWKSK